MVSEGSTVRDRFYFNILIWCVVIQYFSVSSLVIVVITQLLTLPKRLMCFCLGLLVGWFVVSVPAALLKIKAQFSWHYGQSTRNNWLNSGQRGSSLSKIHFLSLPKIRSFQPLSRSKHYYDLITLCTFRVLSKLLLCWWHREELQEAQWEAAKANLVPCHNCQRRFAPDRIRVHERACKGPKKPPPTAARDALQADNVHVKGQYQVNFDKFDETSNPRDVPSSRSGPMGSSFDSKG